MRQMSRTEEPAYLVPVQGRSVKVAQEEVEPCYRGAQCCHLPLTSLLPCTLDVKMSAASVHPTHSLICIPGYIVRDLPGGDIW